MIESVKYRVDKGGRVGLKLKTNRTMDDRGLRVESLIFLDKDLSLLSPMTLNSVFMPTREYTKQLYFMFNKVYFIGRATCLIDKNGQYVSIGISQMNRNNSSVCAYNVKSGEIIATWQPLVVTPRIADIVKHFCNTFIFG